MPMTLLIALCGYLSLTVGLLLVSPGSVVAALLIPASQLFGFYDPLKVEGAFDIHAFVLLASAIIFVSGLGRLRDLRRAPSAFVLYAFFGFWLYGVAAPLAFHRSGLYFSINASKEFMTFFAYAAIFLAIRTRVQVSRAWTVITFFAIYYATVEVLAQAFGASMLDRMLYFFRPEPPFFWKVYLPFWTILLFAFFRTFFSFVLGKQGQVFWAAFLFVGIALTFYRSYLLAVLATLPVVLTLSKKASTELLVRVGSGTAVIGIVILSIVLLKTDNYSALADSFLLSGVREIYSGEGGSLAGRESYAKERRDVLERSPRIGFGFIHKDSHFGRDIQSLIKGQLLGHVDKGDLDLYLKFGDVGTTIFYGLIAYLFIKLLRLARASRSRDVAIQAMTTASVVLVYLIVQPVHSPLTYSFGVLPLAIALALFDREYLLASGASNRASNVTRH